MAIIEERIEDLKAVLMECKDELRMIFQEMKKAFRGFNKMPSSETNEDHGVVVVEYDEDGKRNAKVSTSSPPLQHQSRPRDAGLENEALKSKKKGVKHLEIIFEMSCIFSSTSCGGKEDLLLSL
ncbi:hypothetical protein PTKIN_Ptkin05aG0149200 [Pterospermum kingtungense]